MYKVRLTYRYMHLRGALIGYNYQNLSTPFGISITHKIIIAQWMAAVRPTELLPVLNETNLFDIFLEYRQLSDLIGWQFPMSFLLFICSIYSGTFLLIARYPWTGGINTIPGTTSRYSEFLIFLRNNRDFLWLI